MILGQLVKCMNCWTTSTFIHFDLRFALHGSSKCSKDKLCVIFQSFSYFIEPGRCLIERKVIIFRNIQNANNTIVGIRFASTDCSKGPRQCWCNRRNRKTVFCVGEFTPHEKASVPPRLPPPPPIGQILSTSLIRAYRCKLSRCDIFARPPPPPPSTPQVPQ